MHSVPVEWPLRSAPPPHRKFDTALVLRAKSAGAPTVAQTGQSIAHQRWSRRRTFNTFEMVWQPRRTCAAFNPQASTCPADEKGIRDIKGVVHNRRFEWL